MTFSGEGVSKLSAKGQIANIFLPAVSLWLLSQLLSFVAGVQKQSQTVHKWVAVFVLQQKFLGKISTVGANC